MRNQERFLIIVNKYRYWSDEILEISEYENINRVVEVNEYMRIRSIRLKNIKIKLKSGYPVHLSDILITLIIWAIIGVHLL